MQYVKYFSIHPANILLGLPEPTNFSVRGADINLQIAKESECKAKFKVSVPVDNKGLSLRVGNQPLGGGSPQKGIYVPEAKLAFAVAQSLTRVLSFVLDAPLRNTPLPDSRLIPECDEDKRILENFKNHPMFVDLRAKLSIKAFRFNEISSDTMDQLLAREVGLAIYLDALHITTVIGKYRELWKVLESAFGQKDTELLKSLEEFKPIDDLEFDTEELKELHILRGRASHAESSAGLNEYNAITKEVEDKLPRLKCMVEQILLNKQTWGTRGLGVNQLADLKTYVSKDGTPVLIKAKAPEDET